MLISVCVSTVDTGMRLTRAYISNHVSRRQRLPNGSIDAHDDSGRVSELQEILDRTNKELSQSREASAALGIRIAELEAELTNARRELSRSEELSIKQQREQREVSAGGEGGQRTMGQNHLQSRAL